MRGALISLFCIIFSGFVLVACDTNPPLCTKPDYRPAVLFAETFESYPTGSFPGCGWRDSDRPYNAKEVDIPSNHKMLLDGPSSDGGTGRNGIYYEFKRGTMKPTYIHYKMHPYPLLQEPGSGNSDIGYFVLNGFVEDSGTVSEGVRIFFVHNEHGVGSININGIRYPEDSSNYIDIDKSFTIELRNIHWDTSPFITFDLWINGRQVETCIPFLNPIESIETLGFYNRKYGRIHFDDIFMIDLPVREICPHVSADPPLPENLHLPPPPSPDFTRTPLIFIIQTDAFCRLGPGTNYPPLAVFPESTQLTITGQNLEEGWWWSEDAGCWISDNVGDLVGPWQLLPIILPPPPPTEPVQDEPDQCYEGMLEDACEASGGDWEDIPGKPPSCSCPP